MRNKFIKINSILFLALIIFICLFSNTKVQATLLDISGEFMIPTYKRYDYITNRGDKKYTVLPKYPDYTIYCNSPGQRFDFVQNITREQIQALIDRGYVYTKSCGCFDVDLPDKGHTYPYYEQAGRGSLTNALAYIVTIDGTEWTLGKQRAIWQTHLMGLDGGIINKYSNNHDNDYSDEGYEQEARNYDAFMRALNPQVSATSTNNTLTKIDQISQQYTVGSFSINYTNGTYDGLTFGGISNMYLIGYNENGQAVKNMPIDAFVINGKKVIPDYFTPENINYVDRTTQSYPASGENFQVIFSNPNDGVTNSNSLVCDIALYVEYTYMSATGEYIEYEGKRYGTGGAEGTSHDHTFNPHKDRDEKVYDCGDSPINSHSDTVVHHCGVDSRGIPKCLSGGPKCQPTCTSMCKHVHTVRCAYHWTYIDHTGCRLKYVLTTQAQQGFCSMDGERNIYTTNAITDKIKIRMDLGGYVWEDSFVGKESKMDGLSNTTGDKAIQNIRVMLYDRYNTYIRETRTDSEGYYLFTNLDPMRKYYVAFEYNGQMYIPTQYNRDANNWKNTSKATEISSDRTALDNRFEEIGAYPNNYRRANGRYNKAYSYYELMGFKLNGNGQYTYDKSQHYIDGFYEIKDGNIVPTDKINPAKVSSGDEQKVNFVNDCKIVAYSQAQQNGLNPDLYPTYDRFVINKTSNQTYTTGKQARQVNFSQNSVEYDGKIYEPLYPSTFFIDLGLIRRQEVDLALRKDILYATTKINSKTEVYQYDRRSNNDKYWLIEQRMRDYEEYYGGMYVNGIYKSDYEYRGKETNGGNDLEVYVTYKITVRNSSIDTVGKITEVVDYYDEDYTYVPGLSWVMYKDNPGDNNRKIALKKEDYYNMIANNDLSMIPNTRRVSSSNSSKYNTKSDMTTRMNAIYVRGLENKKLAVGEQAYIYLTFKVKTDRNGNLNLDKGNEFKMNYAEINGYATYYTGNMDLPNGVRKTSNNAAGLIDINSTPGNLSTSDITGSKYEKNFENDTDRAKGIQIKKDDNAVRKISGTVWEDQRTQMVAGTNVGDGVRQNNELKIQGVTVQLFERLKGGKEFLWQTTTTDDKGSYTFSNFIPGEYIVRFIYGHNNETVLINDKGGKNNISYNGQDFKSTIYQKDIEQGVENSKEMKETLKDNEKYYNIREADIFGKNLSDARDLWENKTISVKRSSGPLTTYMDSTKHVYNNIKDGENVILRGRDNINNYLTTEVRNQSAETLAAPYADEINTKYITELINNTQMVAETDIILIEGEYDRQTTLGDSTEKISNGADNYANGNHENGAYEIKNLDFGLTERPKAQLELNKRVKNVRITLANQNVLFDANDAVANLAWIKHQDYDLLNKTKMVDNKYKDYYKENQEGKKYNRYSYKADLQKLIVDTLYKGGKNGLIQVTMDSELMHGATVQITYELKVTNVGEIDYTGKEFYYKATGAREDNKVTTTANLLVDYVANNLQYRKADNEGWTVVKAQDLIKSGNINESIQGTVRGYNTILVTDKINKVLKPGENVTKDLVLTQTITAQNTQDNMTYGNIAEILQTSNTVGRRMAFSIVGNQDPTKAPTEIDSAKAEEVVILPPFGQMYLYLGLGIVVVALIAGAVIVIKKKVLKK